MDDTPTVGLKKAVDCVDKLFSWAQFLALVAIAVAAIVCFMGELWSLSHGKAISLGDLLLLFLYSEVVVMVRAAMRNDHELALVMPIAIAVVAMGRYMVVGADHNALHQLMYASAIFVLILALFLWHARHRFSGKKES